MAVAPPPALYGCDPRFATAHSPWTVPPTMSPYAMMPPTHPSAAASALAAVSHLHSPSRKRSAAEVVE